MQDQQDQQFERDSGRSRWMLVLGITIVVLALAALFLQEREDAGGQERYPDVTGTPSLAPPVSDPPSAGERSQRCGDGLAPPSSDRPTAAPADLQLRVENRALIPVSDTFGPAERSGDVWRCFAHTPMGAVMAAQVISTRRVASPYRVAVGQEQLVANTGRETFLAAAVRSTTSPPSRALSSSRPDSR